MRGETGRHQTVAGIRKALIAPREDGGTSRPITDLLASFALKANGWVGGLPPHCLAAMPGRIITWISMAGLSRILSSSVLALHLMVCCCACQACCEPDRYPDCGARTDDAGLRCGCHQERHSTADCRGGKCSFAPPRRIAGDSFAPIFQPCVAWSADAWLSLSESRFHHQLHGKGRLMPAVRLHLANQVLLI